jgi:hypothetical protein
VPINAVSNAVASTRFMAAPPFAGLKTPQKRDLFLPAYYTLHGSGGITAQARLKNADERLTDPLTIPVGPYDNGSR